MRGGRRKGSTSLLKSVAVRSQPLLDCAYESVYLSGFNEVVIQLTADCFSAVSQARIHGELLKLGIDIGESSVGKYMVRFRQPPSQTWRTFLENHTQQLVSIVSRSCTCFWLGA